VGTQIILRQKDVEIERLRAEIKQLRIMAKAKSESEPKVRTSNPRLALFKREASLKFQIEQNERLRDSIIEAHRSRVADIETKIEELAISLEQVTAQLNPNPTA
jgi:hypothetical protein